MALETFRIILNANEIKGKKFYTYNVKLYEQTIKLIFIKIFVMIAK